MTRRAKNRILQLENKRQCLACNSIKLLTEFVIEARNLSGRGARCIVCEQDRVRELMRRPDVRKKLEAVKILKMVSY
jgi:transcription elongation factor Elf1